MARITPNRLAACGAVLALLVAVTVGSFLAVGAWRVSSAMKRLEASGAPRTIAELELPRAPGPDPAGWMARLGHPVSDVDLEPLSLEYLLARQELGPLGPSMEPAIAAFEACFASDGRSPEAFGNGIFDDLRRGRPLTECQVAALRAMIFVDQDELVVFRQVCEYGGTDWRTFMTDFESSAEPLPDLNFVSLPIAGTRLLCSLAVLSAAEGDPSACLAYLEEASCAARVLEHGPWSTAQLASLLVDDLVFAFGRYCLPYLPKTADVDSLREFVEGRDPRGSFVRALHGDRVLGLRVYDDFASAMMEERGGADGILMRLALEHDRVRYLNTFERGIEHARGDYWVESHGLDALKHELHDVHAWQAVSAMLLPRIDNYIEHSVAAEANQRMTLLALDSLKSDLAQVRDQAQSTVDPFSGEPLRTRMEDDGTLLIWSVGPNLVDDQGQNVNDAERLEAFDVDWDDIPVWIAPR